MSEIPDDVWACAHVLDCERDGVPAQVVGAYMVRAGSLDEAIVKAKAVAAHNARRDGARSYVVVVSHHPGGAGVPASSEGATPPDPAPDVTVEAKP